MVHAIPLLLLGGGLLLFGGKKKSKAYYSMRNNGYSLIDKECQNGVSIYDPARAANYNAKIGEELRNMGVDLGDPSKAEAVLIYLFHNLFLECIDKLPPSPPHLWNLHYPKAGEIYNWEELVSIMKDEMKRYGEAEGKSTGSYVLPGLL